MKLNFAISISSFALICCTQYVEKKVIVEAKPIDSVKKYQSEYDNLKNQFSKTDLSLCEYYRSIDTIKKNAELNADKKYPNELAKHDKYIERYYEQHTRIFRIKYKVPDSISFKSYFIGKLYCK